MLRVGIAVVDITPPPGLPLMGNFRDDYLARGRHDPLTAKAVVFDDGQRRAAVLAIDVCMLDRGNVARVREAIGRSARVSPERVLVHATHTHAAPAPSNRFLLNLDYEPYRRPVEAMLDKAALAVSIAEADLAESELAVGAARQQGLSFNRRLRRRDGGTQMNWESLAAGFDPAQIDDAWGPIDPAVGVLVVRRQGRPAAALVHFGLHPAILAGDNWLYSADYPGALAAAMRRIHGDDFATVFLNGCCGNVNHIDYRDPAQGRGFAMVERVGAVLAAAASEALRRACPLAGAQTPAVAVGFGRRFVELERAPIDEAQRARCEQVLAAARARPLAGQVDGLPEAHFAEVRLQMHAMQHAPDAVEVAALRLGGWALVGLPGEVFCEIGLDVKARSPAATTFVCGLTNDAVGYLPTREAFAQGGYETMVGSTLYQPGAAERLADAAVELLEGL